MRINLLRMMVLVLAGISATSVVACNTVDGAGKDIENAGEAVQDASK